MRFLAIGVLALAAAGCAAGPDYSRPAVATPTTYYGQPAQAAPVELARWWERFDDPVLQQLVADVEAGNLDLKVAAARLIQARESVVQARAGALPSVGVSATESVRTSLVVSVGVSAVLSAGASVPLSVTTESTVASASASTRESVRVSATSETTLSATPVSSTVASSSGIFDSSNSTRSEQPAPAKLPATKTTSALRTKREEDLTMSLQ